MRNPYSGMNFAGNICVGMMVKQSLQYPATHRPGERQTRWMFRWKTPRSLYVTEQSIMKNSLLLYLSLLFTLHCNGPTLEHRSLYVAWLKSYQRSRCWRRQVFIQRKSMQHPFHVYSFMLRKTRLKWECLLFPDNCLLRMRTMLINNYD